VVVAELDAAVVAVVVPGVAADLALGLGLQQASYY